VAPALIAGGKESLSTHRAPALWATRGARRQAIRGAMDGAGSFWQNVGNCGGGLVVRTTCWLLYGRSGILPAASQLLSSVIGTS
jgi:hypothetical protein